MHELDATPRGKPREHRRTLTRVRDVAAYTHHVRRFNRTVTQRDDLPFKVTDI